MYKIIIVNIYVYKEIHKNNPKSGPWLGTPPEASRDGLLPGPGKQHIFDNLT